MSFDIYFIPEPPAGVDLAEFLDELEEKRAEEADDSAQSDRVSWDKVSAAVEPFFPDAEVFDDAECREITDASGTHVTMFPGEISISAPYWFTGAEADAKSFELQRLAAAIEKATGLIAYDPQSDALFFSATSKPALEIDRGSRHTQSLSN